MEINTMTLVALCGGFALGLLIMGYIVQWLVDSAMFKWDEAGLAERILRVFKKKKADK